MLSTKFRINSPFGSGEEARNIFPRLRLWRPSLISDRNDFSSFFIYKSPWCFLPSFESTGLSVLQKKRKLHFQDGSHVRHLGFQIRRILTIFYLLVIPMLPTKSQDNLPFISGEEVKNRFSRWRPSWISHLNDFSYFFMSKSIRCFLPSFKVNWPYVSGEAKNRFSRFRPLRPSWISDRNDFNYFWFTIHPDAFNLDSRELGFQFRRRSEK